MRQPKTRLVDIAREAGVSLATVDRALNGRSGVRDETAEKIRKAIRRLETRSIARMPVTGGRIGRLRFDVVLPAGTNTFMNNLEAALLAAAGDLAETGVMLTSRRIEGFNPAALAETIRTVGEQSDGLAVAALENPLVREAVQEVSRNGVPVVTLVSDLSNSRRIRYVGLDNRAAGRTAGYLMGRFAAGRRGKVALIAGSIGMSYRDHDERELGFRDAVHEQFPNLEIIARFENQDNFQKAHTQTRIILDAHPDLLGIYNIGAGNRGIGAALSERGLKGRVIFIGHELTSFSRAFLIEGVMDAVINQDVTHEATEVLRALLHHHQRTTFNLNLGQPRIEVFVRENLP